MNHCLLQMVFMQIYIIVNLENNEKQSLWIAFHLNKQIDFCIH